MGLLMVLSGGCTFGCVAGGGGGRSPVRRERLLTAPFPLHNCSKASDLPTLRLLPLPAPPAAKWCPGMCYVGSLKERRELSLCKPGTRALWGSFPVPPQSLEGPAHMAPSPPCLPPWPSEPGLHSHTPSSGLWFAVVPGISPGRSESPCPRTVSGGGGGEQADAEDMGALGAAASEWRGEAGAGLPITPFPVTWVGCKTGPTSPLQRHPRKELGQGL